MSAMMVPYCEDIGNAALTDAIATNYSQQNARRTEMINLFSIIRVHFRNP